MTSAANVIGNLPYFSSNSSDWKSFTERLEQYFCVNDIQTEKRAGLLLTTIDDDVYKSLRDLCHPDLPKDKTYQELVAMMAKQIQERTSTYRERVKFHRSKQNETETIAEWSDRMKKLSINCKFGYELDMFLLDQFISGIRSEEILNRLCEERQDALVYQRALEIAMTLEKSIQTNNKV